MLGLGLGLNKRINLALANSLAISHWRRVIDDGGTFDAGYTISDLQLNIQSLIDNYAYDLSTYLVACIDPSIFGYKYRTDAIGTWCVKAYSLMGASSDVVQATENAQPLLLRYEGDKYFYNRANLNDNFLSTPDVAANNILGDIDISAEIDWRSGTTYFCDRRGVNQQYTVWVNGTTSRLNFGFFNGVGLETISSTVNLSLTRAFFRVKRIAATGTVTFYTSSDGITWTQTGATVASTAGNLITQAGDLRIGSTGGGVGSGSLRCYSMQLWDGDRDAGGTLAAEFNAEDYDISVSQNTLTSSTTGEVWTINRNAALFSAYKAQLVFRTTIQFDAINDELVAASVAQAQPNTVYSVFDEMTWSAGRVIIDGGTAIPYSQTTATPNMSSNAGAALDYDGEILSRLKHYMVQFNGASSWNGTNGLYLTGDTGVGDIDALGLGANAGANLANAIINTIIVAKQADDLTTRNSMNTLVRSWNGNPLV